ncbi:molybdenum cofactor biosynthesis protein MoaE [Botrimarina sp.]|uniref:molybdenum cofactor biosynthesis protein MoaE n=1 Tax=Botrimarina sp. TaxID=2795802 RepID=UPI0032F015A7
MSVSVEVAMTEGALARPAPLACPGAGAVVVFEGVVRRLEEGREIDALVYEAYQPMAAAELRRLAERTAAEFGLLAVRVEHSTGRVAVGEVSFRLAVASPHRGEALAALGQFIDEMKRSAPIWKAPAFRVGESDGVGARKPDGA